MDNNNNKYTYFNQILYDNLHSIAINQFEDVEIKQNDNFDGKLKRINYTQAIESFFQNGLNINHYLIDRERYNNTPITMIEDLTIAASNSEALLIIYKNISPEFFQSLPYKEQKSIVSQLINKSFFSDGDIDYLLKFIFNTGFIVKQEFKDSIEIEWINKQKVDPIRRMFALQKDFNFDFKYFYAGKEMDFTSVVQYEINKIKNEKEVGYEAKIHELEFIMEDANSLILYQMMNKDIDSFPDSEEDLGQYTI